MTTATPTTAYVNLRADPREMSRDALEAFVFELQQRLVPMDISAIPCTVLSTIVMAYLERRDIEILRHVNRALRRAADIHLRHWKSVKKHYKADELPTVAGKTLNTPRGALVLQSFTDEKREPYDIGDPDKCEVDQLTFVKPNDPNTWARFDGWDGTRVMTTSDNLSHDGLGNGEPTINDEQAQFRAYNVAVRNAMSATRSRGDQLTPDERVALIRDMPAVVSVSYEVIADVFVQYTIVCTRRPSLLPSELGWSFGELPTKLTTYVYPMSFPRS